MNVKDFVISDFVNFNFLNYNNYFSKPLVLVGNSILVRNDSNFIISSLYFFINKIFNIKNINWKPLAIVPLYLGRISAFELGFLPGVNSLFTFSKSNLLSLFYLCGVDSYNNINDNAFIIYQGSLKTNTSLFNKANLIFPVSTYVERSSTYLNLEGRIRFTKKVITPFKFVFSDFDIVRALFFVRKRFFINNFSKINDFYKTMSNFGNIINYNIYLSSHFDSFNTRLQYISGLNITKLNKFDVDSISPFYLNLFSSSNNKFFFINSLLARSVNNYYSSDFFVKNSRIMSMCALKTFSGNFSTNISKYIN